MPALDPFSASSRPMYAFDNKPSHPLPFAATLQPIDPNTHSDPSPSVPSSLPKPKKYKDTIPTRFPAPPYGHSRQSSFDFRHVNEAIQHSASAAAVGSDEWMQSRVASCVDSANGVLDLKSLGLTQLSTKIADLRDLVTLPPSFSPHASTSSYRPQRSPGAPSSPLLESHHLSPGADHLSANSRSFSRTTSAPASSSFFSNLNAPRGPIGRTPSGLGTTVVSGSTDDSTDTETSHTVQLLASPPLVPSTSDGRQTRRVLSRSKTGAVNLSRGSATRNTSLEILLGGNSLTSLPTALFEISNITVLSLRGNKLKELPAAISVLKNLTELNISNNEISDLPSTILDLNLTLFSVYPNPFHRRVDPKTADPVSYHLTESGRLFGPLIRYDRGGQIPDDPTAPIEHTRVSRLYDICINLLISPRPPSDLPPLLDRYQWDPPVHGGKHPLLDASTLHDMIPSIPKRNLRRALQAMKSSSQAYSNDPSTVSVGVPRSSRGVDLFPRSHRSHPPDNAAENPWFYPCPSPRHLVLDVNTADDRPSRHLFIDSAEERIEWRDVHGESALPIRWKGCSSGCLDFLLEEEDDWELEEED